MAVLGNILGELASSFFLGCVAVLIVNLGFSFIKWLFKHLGQAIKHHHEKQAIKRQLRLYLNEQQKLLLMQLRVEQGFTVLREKMLEEALKHQDEQK